MDEQQNECIRLLYLEMYDKMMSYARSSLGNESLAEEAVQDTFEIACKKAERVCVSPNPQGWLVITLKNTVKNMLSNHSTTKTVVEQYIIGQASNCTVSEDRISLNLLYEDVADSEEFKLLSEMAILGRSHSEMADARGITLDACKKRVQRAKEILKKKLKKDVTF